MSDLLTNYAHLLTHYCIQAQTNHRVLIKSTYLAEPLIKKLYALLLKQGCFVEVDLSFEDQDRLFYDYSSDQQLSSPSVFYEKAVDEFDALIRIIAPFNLKSTASVPTEKKQLHQEALAPLRQRYMQRSALKQLRWVLCVYPTPSAAQECGKSLLEYQDFVYQGALLHLDDPVSAWKKLSNVQNQLVSFLNTVKTMRFIGDKTDLTFDVSGRTWINSDGRYNMPSGEVFTGPIETSVNGSIYFDVPTVYEGQDVSGIYLEVLDGMIQTWQADVGQDVLDRVFNIDGARQFGEVAIGTNYSIQVPSKNILFDEKMGGTVHMAVGASYPETGGENQSAVHWDMIKYMQNNGQIYADNVLIYENGFFVLKEAYALNTIFS